jgi:hypothetical protein
MLWKILCAILAVLVVCLWLLLCRMAKAFTILRDGVEDLLKTMKNGKSNQGTTC